MNKVDVVAHSLVGIAGAKICIKNSYGLNGEGFDGFIVFLEVSPHCSIRFLCFYLDKFCSKGFRYNGAAFYIQLKGAVGNEAAVASGVENGGAVTGNYIWPVVMSANQEVYSANTVKYVKSLVLTDFAVSVAATGVHRYYHYIRIFLCADAVYIALNLIHNQFKGHTAPEFLREPCLDVGVGVAKHCDLETGLCKYLVFREVGLSVVCPKCVCSKEGGVIALKVPGHAVIYGMAGFYIMVSNCNGIVFHVSHQPWEKVRGNCVYVIEIIGGIISLKAVSSVYKRHIIKAVHISHAVYVMAHGVKGLLYASAYIS